MSAWEFKAVAQKYKIISISQLEFSPTGKLWSRNINHFTFLLREFIEVAQKYKIIFISQPEFSPTGKLWS